MIDTARQPQQQALHILQQNQAPESAQVAYQSQGHLLIIGDALATEAATQIKAPLQASILASNRIRTESIHIHGYLGAFQIEYQDQHGKQHSLQADLILDVLPNALLTTALPPPGYYHSNAEKLASQVILLHDMVGTFFKPRYFHYQADICAHGSSQLAGCQQCIQACPAQAIVSIGEKIEVDPYLCQGGGTCATSCPSGAIRYNYPSPAFQIDQLRRAIRAYYQAGGEQASLLFYRADFPLDINQLPPSIIPFALEEIASVGADMWMAALSFGARRILLLREMDLPEVSHTLLTQQIAITQALLNGMGYPAELIQWLSYDDLPHWKQQATGQAVYLPEIPIATHAGQNNKRQQWMLALDHLYQYAPQPTTVIPLPEPAPFGHLLVDKGRCTLCMACSTVCPMNALSGGTETPLLKLHVDKCVQCGLCASACPEQAIHLEAVYYPQREQRMQAMILHEEAPFRCIVCDKAFATQSMITLMLGKLQHHPMFSSERALQRLKMCEDCRVIDVVQDNEMMGEPKIGKVS